MIANNAVKTATAILSVGVVIWVVYFLIALFGAICPQWVPDSFPSWAACSSHLTVCVGKFECFWEKLPLLAVTFAVLVIGGIVVAL